MADFVEQSNTKTAVRELPVPIADITTINTLVAVVGGRKIQNCYPGSIPNHSA